MLPAVMLDFKTSISQDRCHLVYGFGVVMGYMRGNVRVWYAPDRQCHCTLSHCSLAACSHAHPACCV